MSSNLKYASPPFNNISPPYPYPLLPDRIPRRRKRPSHRSRERKTLSRYTDYSDSISIALDENIKLPTTIVIGNRSDPSPLLRRSFDQSWLRWKEKELVRETELAGEMEREKVAVAVAVARECEERRIFGGDVGDDGSLCPKMLEVVRFLFGDDVDYGYYPGS